MKGNPGNFATLVRITISQDARQIHLLNHSTDSYAVVHRMVPFSPPSWFRQARLDARFGCRRVNPGSGSGVEGEEGESRDTPLRKFHEHTAAVKALAWDPHLSGVLATGGRTQDKHNRFWNVFNGTMLS